MFAAPHGTFLLMSALLLSAGCGPGADTSPGTPAPTFSLLPGVAVDDTATTTANASLGDLDGDGDLDLVMARGRHWPLVEHVLLNDGQGGFEARRELGPVSDRTYTAALADLDGDGTLDLVVGNDRPDPKVVYLNEGAGTFRLAGSFGDSAWSTRNLTLADLDGDERPDVIVANRGGPQNLAENQVCLNDGSGSIPVCTVLSEESATTIAAADLDGDGFPDLVVPHRDGGQSYVYRNDGSGHFGEGRPFGPPSAATRAVAVGDLTGDGHPDLVMGDGDGGGATIWVNDGQGGFTGPPRTVGDPSDTPYSIALADLDGDGRLDIVLGNDETPGVVLLNDGDGTTFRSVRFGDGEGAVYGLAVGDVDGDGCMDIVAARSEALSMLFRNGCGG